MLTIYSDDHRLHHAQGEMVGGELKPCFQMPARADHVLTQVRERQLGEVRAPQDFGLAPIARIHIADYLDFLPGVLPARHLRAKRPGVLPVSLGSTPTRPTPFPVSRWTARPTCAWARASPYRANRPCSA